MVVDSIHLDEVVRHGQVPVVGVEDIHDDRVGIVLLEHHRVVVENVVEDIDYVVGNGVEEIVLLEHHHAVEDVDGEDNDVVEIVLLGHHHVVLDLFFVFVFFFFFYQKININFQLVNEYFKTIKNKYIKTHIILRKQKNKNK